MMAHCCYGIVIVATGKDVVSFKTVATKGYNIDERFGNITEVARCPLIKPDPALHMRFVVVPGKYGKGSSK
jgi:hypothetical protein